MDDTKRKNGKKQSEQTGRSLSDRQKESRKLRICQMLAVGSGLVLLVAGGLRGETRTVLTKAATICLECIGIG